MAHFPGYRVVDGDGDILMADAHPEEFDRVFAADYIPQLEQPGRAWQRYVQGFSGTNQPRVPIGSPTNQGSLPNPFGNQLRHLPLPYPSRVFPHFPPQTLHSPTPADAKGPSLPPLASVIAGPYSRQEFDHRPRQHEPSSNQARGHEVIDLTQSPSTPRTREFFLPPPDAFFNNGLTQTLQLHQQLRHQLQQQRRNHIGVARVPGREHTPATRPVPSDGITRTPVHPPRRPQTPPHGHRRRMTRPSTPRISCTACLEDFKRDELLQLTCNCRYCTPCLNLSFIAGCANMASFPPKCCGKPLRISVWGSLLEADVLDRYKKIEAEFSTNRPLYCASPKCSAFIRESDVLPQQGVGVCPKCSNSTCRDCRRLMGDHAVWQIETRVCPKEDENLTKLYELGNAKKWKQCPSCLNMVEKTDGCNHMDCVCGVEFCYLCGKLFDEEDDCECEPNTWGEDEEDDEEENEDEEDEEDEDDDEWPDFRTAVDPAGRPKCLHPHTAPLGTNQFICHGCLRPNTLLTCEDCALELCQACVDNVRSSASSGSDDESDDDSDDNSNGNSNGNGIEHNTQAMYALARNHGTPNFQDVLARPHPR